MSCVPLRRGDVWIAEVSFPDKPEAPMVKFCVILQDERDRFSTSQRRVCGVPLSRET